VLNYTVLIQRTGSRTVASFTSKYRDAMPTSLCATENILRARALLRYPLKYIMLPQAFLGIDRLTVALSFKSMRSACLIHHWIRRVSHWLPHHHRGIIHLLPLLTRKESLIKPLRKATYKLAFKQRTDWSEGVLPNGMFMPTLTG
jgi:hypothetical protein